MNAHPNNGTVIGEGRVLLTTTDRKPSLPRLAFEMIEALWTGATTDPEWHVLQIRNATTEEVLAERRFEKRRLAKATRDAAVGRATDSTAAADWQKFLDAS